MEPFLPWWSRSCRGGAVLGIHVQNSRKLPSRCPLYCRRAVPTAACIPSLHPEAPKTSLLLHQIHGVRMEGGASFQIKAKKSSHKLISLLHVATTLAFLRNSGNNGYETHGHNLIDSHD
ncbi:uncharacterized protein LOC120651982 [Panicum virgatum]|uniref:uncharacterized protein LOC120651982 n=1 Tax=Panicum virgatum TaxID=38727 RepID=UPI0019D5EAE2|nr:uncharacterized protein LOC120651982 [Panicum virgatum]